MEAAPSVMRRDARGRVGRESDYGHGVVAVAEFDDPS
jgi:hypothetical protein